MNTSILISASFAAAGESAQASEDLRMSLARRAALDLTLLESAIDQTEEEESPHVIEFEPRYETPDGPDELEFQENVRPQRESMEKPVLTGADMTKAFASIQLVSPRYFHEAKALEATNKENQPQQSSKLSDMVHPIDLSLFQSTTPKRAPQDEPPPAPVATPKPKIQFEFDYGVRKPRATPPQGKFDELSKTSVDDASSAADSSFYSCNSAVASSNYSTAHSRQSLRSRLSRLQTFLRGQPLAETPPSTKSRLASSFRSSGSKSRVRYRLDRGRSGMTDEERSVASDMLPTPLPKLQSTTSTPRAVITPAPPKPVRAYPKSIYVLLLEPHQKLFEIVQVGFLHELTVGDVLAKARSSASDPALSDQRYTSLINAAQELAAPMLPVRHLLTKSSVGSQDVKRSSRRRNRQCLLTAVGESSSAAACRAATEALLQHPRLQRWLKKADPFHVQVKETK